MSKEIFKKESNLLDGNADKTIFEKAVGDFEKSFLREGDFVDQDLDLGVAEGSITIIEGMLQKYPDWKDNLKERIEGLVGSLSDTTAELNTRRNKILKEVQDLLN